MERDAAPTEANVEGLPMMPGESVDMAFGERAGTGAAVDRERNALLLTDRRVIRLSRTRAGLSTTFLSLGDVLSAEVAHRSRGVKRLFRMAILLAGAGAALAAVEWQPLSWGLAALLGLGALHHLYQFVSVSHEGSILFRAAQQEVSIPYRGRTSREAYDLVNRFFELKAAYSPALFGGDGRIDRDALMEWSWLGGEGEDGRRPDAPGDLVWLWGVESPYEAWYMERSVPVAQLRLRQRVYETWYMERDVPVAELRSRAG